MHLRLAAPPYDGYEPADLDRAPNDYHAAGRLVLNAVQSISEHNEELTHT